MNKNNFLADLYGSEESPSKIPIIMCAIFTLIAFVELYAIFNIPVDIVTNFFRWCATVTFLVTSFFVLSAYFFQKKSRNDRYRILKYTTFIISLVLLALILFPLTLILWLSDQIKFHHFFRFSTVYIVCIFIPLLLSLVTGSITYFLITRIAIFNAVTIASLVAFLIWIFGSKFILWCFYRFNKKNITSDIYFSIKKDLYIIVFAFITVGAVLVNCIIWGETYKPIISGLSGAFALYIAFDRLFGKWEKANKDYDSKASELQNVSQETKSE